MVEIKIHTEYIKLGQFLKFQGFISNGSEAKNFLEINKIFVNSEIEQRRGRKLYPKDEIEVNKVLYIIIEEK